MDVGPVAVELLTLDVSSLETRTEFLGVLDAPDGIVLQPEVDGRVVDLFVSSGETVSVGDPIARLSPARGQAEVNAAIANTTVARSALANAQAQVRVATAEKVRAEAEVALQQSDLERIQYLVTEGAESQRQLDVMMRNRDGAIATLNAAIETIAATEAGVREAEAALIQAQAQVSAVQSDLSDTLITAPIAGVVGDLVVKQGDYVEAGDDLTTIVQNQTLELSLAIPVEYRNQLQLGLPVVIHPVANHAVANNTLVNNTLVNNTLANNSPERLKPEIVGTIQFIAPQVDAATQTITAEAIFDNATGTLVDEQRVDATIIWHQQPGLLVPANAISRVAGQPFVFVATPSSQEDTGAEAIGQGETGQGETEQGETGTPGLIAQHRSITLGKIQGNHYQVLDGIEPGESIVVSGVLALSNGMAIAPLNHEGSQL